MQQASPFWVRIALLLFCVAVIGTLIGFGWEEHVGSAEQDPLEALGSPTGLPQSPAWHTGPSREEKKMVQRATAELPPYKDARPQALAADFLDPGSSIAVAWFMTRDTPDDVLGFYRKALLEAGLPVVQHRYNANAGYVGFVEPSTQQSHLVSVIAQGGETAVFVSNGQVSSFLEGQGQVPEALPMPEHTEAPTVLTLRQEGRVRYSVHAQVPQARPAEILGFYRTALEARGWTLEDVPGQGRGEAHLLARREDAWVSGLVKAEGDGVRLLFTMDAEGVVQ